MIAIFLSLINKKEVYPMSSLQMATYLEQTLPITKNKSSSSCTKQCLDKHVYQYGNDSLDVLNLLIFIIMTEFTDFCHFLFNIGIITIFNSCQIYNIINLISPIINGIFSFKKLSLQCCLS